MVYAKAWGISIMGISDWIVLIVSAIIGPVLVGVIVAYFNHRFKVQEEKQKEMLKQAQAEKEKMELAYNAELRRERKEDFVEVVTPVQADVKELKEDMKLLKDSEVLSLRMGMRDIHDTCLFKGYASEGDKLTMSQSYSKYIELGGNNLKECVDAWKEEVMNLPSVPPEK